MKVQKLKAFKNAVLVTEDIKDCYQKGLRGLGDNTAKVTLQQPNRCGGSVEIDKCTSQKYPNSNRWDYVFDYKGEAFFKRCILQIQVRFVLLLESFNG